MTPTPVTSDTQSVLQALAPTLTGLEAGVRTWWTARHPQPLTPAQDAKLGELADDLARQADALRAEQPLLIIVFMGGTGVGKSTLLNALAGAPIASASFARPTTRDPVVYLHESISPQKLDPALHSCRIVAHNRDSLRQKVLVDTPDVDSNDLANREKLLQALPAADVVLYVGSQEKYHDQIGWDLFLQQKQRRAFAFVLNKWDRCRNVGAGARPDEDWKRDLVASGFEHPLLFRTCAQHWVDHPYPEGTNPTPAVPEETFLDLVRWLEQGISRIEIEAIKGRGVGRLLDDLGVTIEAVAPPDLTAPAAACDPAWRGTIHRDVDDSVALLLSTLEPHRDEIERHFAERRRHQFTGLMGGYLGFVQRLRSLGARGWRPRIPWVPSLPTRAGSGEKPVIDINLVDLLSRCSRDASDRHLDARHKALTTRLLLDAERLGVPLTLLQGRLAPVDALDWRARRAQAMLEVFTEVERAWVEPTGSRRILHRTMLFLGNTLPSVSLFAMVAMLLWQYFMDKRPFALYDLLLPLAVVVFTMVILHVLIALVLPMRWPSLRAEFRDELVRRLEGDVFTQYLPLPAELASDLRADRERALGLRKKVAETTAWLEARERGAAVMQLYG
jgi:energy-coupling factor transporter ATP-binding protein EcfA2